MCRNKCKLMVCRLFICGLILCVVNGCTAVKPSGSSGSSKLFETFFVGEDGTQYFIKPLLFESDDSGTLYCDYTFRYKDEVKDSVAMNFSIHHSEMTKHLDSVQVSSDEYKIVASPVKFLFNERESKLFESRFSVKFPLSQFIRLMKEQHALNMTLYEREGERYYQSTDKAEKNIKKLHREVFVLF